MPVDEPLEEWEDVDHNLDTQRLKVPGGWLYMTRLYEDEESTRFQIAMCFVPRPPGQA